MEQDIKEFIKETLKEIINERTDSNLHRSDSINELAAALAKAQGEYPPIYANRKGLHNSKYADLDGLMLPLRPILSKNGLSFLQELQEKEDGKIFIVSTLQHSSGQWRESSVGIKATKNDIHGIGSGITYMCRYAAKAMLNITVAEDTDDDDGARIVSQGYQQSSNGNDERIGQEMAGFLEQELEGFPDLKKTILEKTGISSLAYLPKAKYQSTIDWIRKNTRQQ